MRSAGKPEGWVLLRPPGPLAPSLQACPPHLKALKTGGIGLGAEHVAGLSIGGDK